MIITKTPLRISFFSGGSDMPAFYEKETGAALSVTIDKYIYVMVNDSPHLGIRTVYDAIETYPDVETMQHLITKEALKYYKYSSNLTIASISDILAKGSGLGSSSAFTVGLVNALSATQYKVPSRGYLAETACEIEMERCGYPVGKQDQYAAAYGGFNLFEFQKNGQVNSSHIYVDRGTWNKLEENLILVYSGYGRSANGILQKQQDAMSDKKKFELVKRSRNKAYIAQEMLVDGDIDKFGELLHEAWLDKKGVVESITDKFFDKVYDAALKNGATGGKLLGAGGGGFFLFYAPKLAHPQVKDAIKFASDGSCAFYDFKFVDRGSQVVAIC
jgi:D-glycero-alpha-D-manno-heptose-7-phosphate kinase